MKETNNFEQIQKIIDGFDKTPDKFYFVQVLNRKGNNMNLNSSNRARTIKSYFIPSTSDLEKYKKEIIFLCESTGARAYINLNARSFKKAALKNILLLSNSIDNGHENTAHTTYCKAVMDSSIIDGKVWILDFDKKDYNSSYIMGEEFSRIVTTCVPAGNYINQVPSKNGFHILVKPFRRDTFLIERERMNYKAELKIDASTNLYIPKDDTLQDFDQISLEF